MAEGDYILPPLDDRRGDRYGVKGDVVLKILYTSRGEQELKKIRAKVKDAGVGGLCVEPEKEVDLDEGVLADLDFRLEGAPARNSLGLIRWAKREKGIGIEFFYGSAEERDALRSYIEAWVKKHGAEPLPREE